MYVPVPPPKGTLKHHTVQRWPGARPFGVLTWKAMLDT